MPYASGPGGQIVNEPAQGGGLLGALFDPTVQAQRLQNQQAQIGINAATAFQNGVPTNPDGSLDTSTMVNTLIQKGDLANAEKLQQYGVQMQGIKLGLDSANALQSGNYGQAGTGGSGSTTGVSPAGGSGSAPVKSGSNTGPADPNVVNFIKAYSQYKGVNPNVSLAVAGAEGLNGFDPNGNANLGDGGSSAGPFQLHYGGVASGGNAVAGLGDEFTKQTGLDARDPSTWKQQVMFSIDHAAENGWNAWHGAKAIGLDNWAGIGNPSNPPNASSANPNAPAGSGSQAPLISFGGNTAGSQSPSAQPPAAAAQPTAAGAPIGDSAVMAARNRLAAAQDLDPSNLTTAQQKQLTADTGTVAAYTAQQATPQVTATAGTGDAAGSDGSQGARPLTIRGPGNVQMAQNGDSDAPSSVHPFGAAPASVAAPQMAGPGIPASAPGVAAAPPQMPVQRPPMVSPPVGGQAVPQPSSSGPGLGAAPPQPGLVPQGGPPVGPGPQMAQTVASAPGRAPFVPPPMVPTPNSRPGFVPPPMVPVQGSTSGQPGSGQALMIDPTMGGLLKGQFVGNPGGAINYLRAMETRLGTLQQKPAADAFGKQADMIENAVARSDITTPDMKNYAVARSQGFAGSMMDFQNAVAGQKAQAEAQARLQSDIDPSRAVAAGQVSRAQAQAGLDVSSSPQAIQAAGLRSQADAAGAQLGQNSTAAIAARGQNASTVAESTQTGEALGKLPAQYAAAADQAKTQNAQLDQLLDSGSRFNMGANAQGEQAYNAQLSDLGKRFGVDTSAIDGKVAAYQEYGKIAGQITRAAMKETGSSRGGIQEMQFVNNTLPSPTTSPDGLKGVVSSMKGYNDFTMAKQQAASNYAAQNGNSLNGFDTTWNKSVTPAAFVLHRMQIDQPQVFATTVQRLGQSDQGRAVLQSVKSGVAFANQQGLLD